MALAYSFSDHLKRKVALKIVHDVRSFVKCSNIKHKVAHPCILMAPAHFVKWGIICHHLMHLTEEMFLPVFPNKFVLQS